MLDAEQKCFMEIWSKNLETVNSLLKSESSYKQPKSIEISENARKQGDDLFYLNEHDNITHSLILDHYCKSMAFAPPASTQLLLTLMNRSAFLLHIHKYEDSLNDLEKALTLCTPNELQTEKLLSRILQCLKKLGSSVYYERMLGLVQKWRESITEEQVKHDIERLMDEVKNTSLRTNLKSNDKCSHSDRLDVIPSCSNIKVDSEHGRHLVAARRFNPGEIIFSEKSFVFMNVDRKYSQCNYCLQICWSSVPCDHCTWASFCSNTCKNQAWLEYHDVECSTVPDTSKLPEWFGEYQDFYRLWARMLTIGIRQASNIAKLKAKLESRQNLQDVLFETYLHDGTLGNYSLADIITLNNETNDPNFENYESSEYSHILPLFVYFVKNSPFFRGTGNMNKLEELIEGDALFIGSLLVKFAKMKPQITFNFNHYDTSKPPKDPSKWRAVSGKRNIFFAPCISLIAHSCYPNADSVCYNNNGELIVCALQPIKEGSKITVSYAMPFYQVAKNQRQNQLRSYQISCDCPACSNDWPDLLNPSNFSGCNPSVDKYLHAMYRQTERKPFKDHRQLLKYIFFNMRYDNFVCDRRIFAKISSTVKLAMTRLEHPSILTCFYIQALREAFASIYHLKLDFGCCKKQKSKRLSDYDF